jgi:hypothetical protein
MDTQQISTSHNVSLATSGTIDMGLMANLQEPLVLGPFTSGEFTELSSSSFSFRALISMHRCSLPVHVRSHYLVAPSSAILNSYLRWIAPHLPIRNIPQAPKYNHTQKRACLRLCRPLTSKCKCKHPTFQVQCRPIHPLTPQIHPLPQTTWEPPLAVKSTSRSQCMGDSTGLDVVPGSTDSKCGNQSFLIHAGTCLIMERDHSG